MGTYKSLPQLLGRETLNPSSWSSRSSCLSEPFVVMEKAERESRERVCVGKREAEASSLRIAM